MPRQERIQSGTEVYHAMMRGITDGQQIQKLYKEQRDVILAALLRRHAGVKQLQRLTGISKNIISNVSKTTIWLSESRESLLTMPSMKIVGWNPTISLSQKTRENLFALAWREIALLRTISLSQKTRESLFVLAWRGLKEQRELCHARLNTAESWLKKIKSNHTFKNVFVKPDEQWWACSIIAIARKRCVKMNI